MREPKEVFINIREDKTIVSEVYEADEHDNADRLTRVYKNNLKGLVVHVDEEVVDIAKLVDAYRKKRTGSTDDLVRSLAKEIVLTKGWDGKDDKEFARIFEEHNVKILTKVREIIVVVEKLINN